MSTTIYYHDNITVKNIQITNYVNSLQGSVAERIKQKACNMFTYHEESWNPVRSKHLKIDPQTLLKNWPTNFTQKLTHKRYSENAR